MHECDGEDTKLFKQIDIDDIDDIDDIFMNKYMTQVATCIEVLSQQSEWLQQKKWKHGSTFLTVYTALFPKTEWAPAGGPGIVG